MNHEQVRHAIEAATGIEYKSIISTRRFYRSVLARAIIVRYYRLQGWSHANIAIMLQRDRTSIIHADQMHPIYMTEPLYREWLEKFQTFLENELVSL